MSIYTKLRTAIFLLILGQSSLLIAQDVNPVILHGPTDWRYEKIEFPLDFAPELAYEGFEELRFAPGMFDRVASNYFSYVFVIALDNAPKLKSSEIQDFLSKYYKGLCAAVAESKKSSPDLSKIKVTLKKSKKVWPKSKSYDAQVIYLDTFNEGQVIQLQMELEVVKDKSANTSYMFAIVSPAEKRSEIWKELYQIREGIQLNQ